MTELGINADLVYPQLRTSPRAAIAQAKDIIATSSRPVTLIGSSQGGFFATCLAEMHGLRAVLVNPAVIGCLKLTDFIGTHTHLYTGETFEFTLQDAEDSRQMNPPLLTKLDRYWLLAETGDEVLDYRHAVERYAGARQSVFEGGDHSFTRWPALLDDILKFAGYRF